jgi:hypothetical protein
MFQKLNFKFSNDVIKKILYITKHIDKCTILDHNKLEDYVFYEYEEGSEEKEFCEKFKKQIEKHTKDIGLYYDHKIIDFPYKKFIECLPKSLLEKEIPTLRWQKFGARSAIPAHVDLDRLCSINFYLSVSNETTLFYNKKRSGFSFKLKHEKIVNESFLDEWLEPTVSFIAQQFDVYLLNSSQPHAVLNTTEKDRISLQFSFKKTPFETVLNELNNYV